jgi:fatty-acid desaturase
VGSGARFRTHLFCGQRRRRHTRWTLSETGHTFGYKSFANDATNLRLLALLTFGEGLHNNHHTRPASPKLSAFRGEFDPAWPVIRILVALRLAEVLSKVDEGWENHRRRIPRTVVSPGRTSKGKTHATERKDVAT